MHIETPFAQAITKNIRATVKTLKADGTVAMSEANLRQVTPTPSSALTGAPRGTNAQWTYSVMFEQAIRLLRFNYLPLEKSGGHVLLDFNSIK